MAQIFTPVIYYAFRSRSDGLKAALAAGAAPDLLLPVLPVAGAPLDILMYAGPTAHLLSAVGAQHTTKSCILLRLLTC